MSNTSDPYLFNSIVDELKRDSAGLMKTYKSEETQQQSNNFIDINQFIKVLYTLFDINSLLLNSDRVDGIDTATKINQDYLPNKFYFSEEYPDQETSDRDIITVETIKLAPAALGSNEAPFQGTKQYRPMLMDVTENKIKGCFEANLMTLTDNRLRFTCWSVNSGHTHKLAKFLRQFIAKYYWFLRRFVSVLIFEGQNKESKIDTNYGPLRYHSVYMDYFIRTAEFYSLSEDEVKSIEININRIKTILNNFSD